MVVGIGEVVSSLPTPALSISSSNIPASEGLIMGGGAWGHPSSPMWEVRSILRRKGSLHTVQQKKGLEREVRKEGRDEYTMSLDVEGGKWVSTCLFRRFHWSQFFPHFTPLSFSIGQYSR